MLISTRARAKFNLLLEASASHAARHYSAELQEAYEAHVYDAAREFVAQVADDDAEAANGSYNVDHLMDVYDNEAPF